jgi:predicted house-cleaning noncanonical NTP pyrophosphatase (MazG superfamily)
MNGRRIQPGKLVRDKIPDIIRSHGDEPVTRVAGFAEYRSLLRDKLTEEAAEVASATGVEDTAEELADVLECVQAITADLGLAMADVERVRAAKAAERGGFTQRIVWYDDGSIRSAPGWRPGDVQAGDPDDV